MGKTIGTRILERSIIKHIEKSPITGVGVGKDFAILNVDESRQVDSKKVSITLYAGLLKNNKLDFVIQKAVELGVDKIVPFVYRNSVETKFSQERGQRIALEAAKQCGSAYLSSVGELKTFEQVLN